MQLLLYAGGIVTIAVFAIVVTERLVGERHHADQPRISAAAPSWRAALLWLVAVIARRAPLAVTAAGRCAGDLTQAIGEARADALRAAVRAAGRADARRAARRHLLRAARRLGAWALQAYLIARRRRLLHRPVRRDHAPQHHRHPARHRADAERRQHQPGGVRPLHRRRGRAWSSRVFTICITVAEAALGLAIVILLFRVRRTVDGRPPGSAQGMTGMTDAGLLALIALLLPALSFLVLALVAPLRRARAAGGLVLDPVRRRARWPPRSSRWQSRRPATRRALVWPWLPVGRRAARHGRRPRRRRLDADARARRAGVASSSSSTRSATCTTSRRAVARPLLRLPVALRVLDDGARARAQLPAALHLLGAGRPLLVPADRLLVPASPRRRARR